MRKEIELVESICKAFPFKKNPNCLSKQQNQVSQNLDNVGIGIHMISNEIWNKSTRINFSKANQIARARRVSAICSL